MSDRIRIRVMARSQFWQLAETAKTQGRDLAEVLDREGVLVTPERHKLIRKQAIDEVANFIEALSVQQITGRTIGVTGNDVQSGVVRLLREMTAGE